MGAKGSRQKKGSKGLTPERASGGDEDVGKSAQLVENSGRSASGAATGGYRYHTVRKFEEDYRRRSKVLGTGLNGAVVICVEKIERGRQFACKQVQKPSPSQKNSERLMEFLKNEIQVYLALDHPHIAKLYDVYDHGNTVTFVMELCNGGELYSRLSLKHVYSEGHARKAAEEMLLAISYLHEKHVVHRDLKLENFLYETEDQNSIMKLVDFGFAKFFQNTERMQASCGSMTYVAPEVLERNYEGNTCDVWSLGVTIYILLFGHPPFNTSGDAADARKAVKGGKFSRRKFHSVSEPAQDFICQMLELNVKKRLTAISALQHPWISKSAEAPTLPLDVVNDMMSFASASQMKRACLAVAVHCVTSEETSQLRQLFLSLDTSNDGTISVVELKDALRNTTDVDVEEIETLFGRLDQLGDNRLCYNEFLAATVQGQLRTHEHAIRATFARLDADHSGVITQANLREVLGECDAAAFIAEADYMKDGVIHYEEFFRYVTENGDDKSIKVGEQILRHTEVEQYSKLSTMRNKKSFMSGEAINVDHLIDAQDLQGD